MLKTVSLAKALGILVVIFTFWFGYTHPLGTAVTTSQQTQNLEVLQATKQNDLVFCTAEKPGALQPEIKFAFLVEQNNGRYMTGYYPSQYTLSRADGGESFSLLSEWKCKMHILRPSKTRAASDMLASIILYGLNPKQ